MAVPERSAPGWSVPVDKRQRARHIVMLVNGVFLTVIGALQVSFELLGYYAGAGPLGSVFEDSPYTIGWVENHGFALLIGVLFLAVAVKDGRRFWHGFGLAVHILLGAANVMFWDSFVHFDVVPMGIAATAAHVLLIAAQSWCLIVSRRSVTVSKSVSVSMSGPVSRSVSATVSATVSAQHPATDSEPVS